MQTCYLRHVPSVLNNSEVSQGRCPHFRGFEKRISTVYRGVLISGGLKRGFPLYTEVSSFQGVGIEEFPLCTEVSSFQGELE